MINKTKTRSELYEAAILKADIRWKISTMNGRLGFLKEIDLGTETRNETIGQLIQDVAELKELLNKESS